MVMAAEVWPPTYNRPLDLMSNTALVPGQEEITKTLKEKGAKLGEFFQNFGLGKIFNMYVAFFLKASSMI